MLARVTTLWLPPSRLDAAVRFVRDTVVPAMQPQPGWGGSWLLVDPPAGKLLAISLWETLPEMEATSFLYQELRAKVGELFGGPPITEPYAARPPEQAMYEVRDQPTRPAALAAAQVARVTTVQGDPARVEDLFRQFQAQLAPVLARLRGYVGIYLLVDAATGTVATVSLWASAADLAASEAAVGPLRTQAGQTLGARAAPTVEQYEVAGTP